MRGSIHFDSFTSILRTEEFGVCEVTIARSGLRVRAVVPVSTIPVSERFVSCRIAPFLVYISFSFVRRRETSSTTALARAGAGGRAPSCEDDRCRFW